MRENSWGSRSVLSASARMDIRSLCPIAPSTEKSSGSRCSEATETKYRLLPALPCGSPCGRIHFLRAVIEIPRRTRPLFHSGSALPLSVKNRLDEVKFRCFPTDFRSEEHTSELQSLTNLVCRLLLEKKKAISLLAGRLEGLSA